MANSLAACVFAAAAAILAARQLSGAGPGHGLLPVLLSGAFLVGLVGCMGHKIRSQWLWSLPVGVHMFSPW